ncbi:MAG: hypothetical protein ACLFV7_06480 [Phycisphaerae bacterium]
MLTGMENLTEHKPQTTGSEWTAESAEPAPCERMMLHHELCSRVELPSRRWLKEAMGEG